MRGVHESLITDIALCIIAAWVLAVVFHVGRQPLLLAYLVAGFTLGPSGFGFVDDHGSIETIASIGLVLLLFLIGLEIDLRKMLGAGRVITVTAMVQILGSGLIGYIVFCGTGLAKTRIESLYLAVAVALSSTVIVVKILYDKRELQTLTGRITLGILVLQDLAAILFLALEPNLSSPSAGAVALSLGKVALLVGAGFSVSRYLLPPVFAAVARLPELVLVGALAWCFAMAGLASLLGLSREMGALVAGVAVSTFPYALDVVAKVTSIRDFFVTLFFVALGMSVPLPTWDYAKWMMVVSGVVVASRFLTVFGALFGMSQGHRASLLPAVNLCQISELSLVILALGQKSGRVSEQAMSTTAFAFAFLAVASTYAMLKDDPVVQWISSWLPKIGLRDLDQTNPTRLAGGPSPRLFLLGFSWAASSLLEEIRRHRPELLEEVRVVDFNPLVYGELRRRGISVVYGDIAQRSVLEQAGISEARIVVCSLPNTLLKGTTNLRLLQEVRALNPTAHVIVHAERLSDAATLDASGVSLTLAPRLLEAEELLAAIDAADRNLLAEKKRRFHDNIANRDEVVP